MALRLAVMLEEVAIRDDWTDSVLESMNAALGKFSVSPGYNLMVTIAGRSYVFTSDHLGQVQVSMPGPGKQTLNALTRASVRIVVDYDAFKDYDSTARTWAEDMVVKRKIRFEGDRQILDTFDADLGPVMVKAWSALTSGGPGKDAIAQARAESLAAFDGFKSQDQSSWQSQLDQTTAQFALAAYDYNAQPEFMAYGQWLHFSALSTMTGNLGQSNYVAINCLLDVTSFNARINQRPNDLPTTMMWGAVTGIGMRWKAFASEDFLAKDDNFADMLVDYKEAMGGLRFILRGFAPEWVTCALFDRISLEKIKAGTLSSNSGIALGRGGGLSLDNNDASPEVDDEVGEVPWLRPGRRMEICGLVKAPEMNGMKCTLLEEIGDEKWQVRVDGDVGDKIIRITNMKRYSDKPITMEDHSTRDFSLAGTWSDWVPQDMVWDSEEKCHTLETQIDKSSAVFDIRQGKAGPLAWKNRSSQWQIRQPGKYQIKVFCKDGGKIHHVESKRVGDVEVRVPQSVLDASALRVVLQGARPNWTDKELTSVQGKLAKVGITTVSDFLEGIKRRKNGLNKRLKEVDEKAFSDETMSAFRDYVDPSA